MHLSKAASLVWALHLAEDCRDGVPDGLLDDVPFLEQEGLKSL